MIKKLLLAAILFLGAAPCWGQCLNTTFGNTITCVQKVSIAECGASASCATNVMLNTTTGNAYIVYVEWITTGGVTFTCSTGLSVSSGSATWALAKANLGTVVSLTICYATNITGGTGPTITATVAGGTPNAIDIASYELNGLATSPVDVTTPTGTGGGSASWSFGPTGATTQANEYLVCAITGNGSAFPISAPGGGFVIEANGSGFRTAILDQGFSSINTATCSGTLSGAPAEWDGIIASFKAASPGVNVSGGMGGKAGIGGKGGLGYWQPVWKRRERLQ